MTTTANTLGGMLGSLLAAWVLLPSVGIEWSFFVLALLYGLMALSGAADAPVRRAPSPRGKPAWPWRAVFLLALALFPFGWMEQRFIPATARRWLQPDTRIAGVREGLNQTLVYLEDRRFGETLHHRLITNSFSMAGTTLADRRYMSQFAWWPVSAHPRVRRVLLLGYGVGVTAGAMTDVEEIEEIDVVDISRGIVEMNRLVHADDESYPPNDPRLRNSSSRTRASISWSAIAATT